MKLCIICHNLVRKKFELYTLVESNNRCDCNPIIHKTCFEKWIKISNSCPICRKKYDAEEEVEEEEADSESEEEIIHEQDPEFYENEENIILEGSQELNSFLLTNLVCWMAFFVLLDILYIIKMTAMVSNHLLS